MADEGAIRVATWNINGLRARIDTLLAWIGETAPDVLLLQETKIQDDAFPRSRFEDAGYNVAVHGEKAYNGVAILSRLQLEDISFGLPGDSEDRQARWIEATVCPGKRILRVCGLYAPNGNPAPGEKYTYKLNWMKRLSAYASALLANEDAIVMGGDFNVIPQPEDAFEPKRWGGDALFLPETRMAWRRIVHAGWTDAFRILHPEAGHYSFWDYQKGAWDRDDGVRIDHLLLSPQAADRLCGAGIVRKLRGRPKPSDHVPVWCELKG